MTYAIGRCMVGLLAVELWKLAGGQSAPTGGYGHTHYASAVASLQASVDTVVLLAIALGVAFLVYEQIARLGLFSPKKVIHKIDSHLSAIKCKACGLIVHRYDERGVCANCVSEGK